MAGHGRAARMRGVRAADRDRALHGGARARSPVLLRSPSVDLPPPLTPSWAFCGGALGVGGEIQDVSHVAASPRGVRWFRETLALALLFATFVGCSLTLSLLLELESGLLYWY